MDSIVDSLANIGAFSIGIFIACVGLVMLASTEAAAKTKRATAITVSVILFLVMALPNSAIFMNIGFGILLCSLLASALFKDPKS